MQGVFIFCDIIRFALTIKFISVHLECFNCSQCLVLVRKKKFNSSKFILDIIHRRTPYVELLKHTAASIFMDAFCWHRWLLELNNTYTPSSMPETCNLSIDPLRGERVMVMCYM